ncbi:MAG: isopentenyl phosphate kinase family protein [Thaumarchaeota archaeon]|nr:isopentenyl phosphate kinase family protein [Nitrososphaerota archaeon]
MERVVILKIGGSVITEKGKPFTLRKEGIETVAGAIAEYSKPLVIVHGAGSFGHFIARKYGLSRNPSNAKPEEVSEIRASVLKLNSIVVETIQSKGVSVYWFQPYAFSRERNREKLATLLIKLIQKGISPLSFGDVIPTEDGFRIISGDEIVRDLAILLKPSRVVFAMDIDGIYRNFDEDKKPLQEISIKDIEELTFKPVKDDVTGGMEGKLGEAVRIAKAGIDVLFSNGLKKERLMKALKGKDPHGTLVRGRVVA